ncbi:MAG: hypothetical protein GX657_10275 [Chloroflexi bacterium]|jgi:hypothetical protein|nr:hypothetical protein [Chloroflexota bacterium]
MDTVLVALLVMMMMLHGVMTVATGWTSAQELTSAAWADMAARTSERASTGLRIIDVEASGSTVLVTVQNSGEVRLAGFDAWDVILHCHTALGQYRIERLPLAGGALPGEGWSVQGLYLQAAERRAEVYEPGVLNPGEEMIIRASLSVPLAEEATHLLVVGTPNGVTSSRQFTATP